MSDEVLYRGITVFFQGKEWIVPSLSVGQFEDNYDKLTKIEPVTDQKSLKKQFSTLLPIIGLAIRRNYPDVRDEDLRNWLDLATFKVCLRAVQNMSGLTEGTPGEA